MHTLGLKIYEANGDFFINSLKQGIKVVLFHNEEKWALGPFKENI